jgi:glycosyltransferase involved in cell wall biosynthesis
VGDGELREQIERQISEENLPVVLMGWRTDVFDILELVKLVIQTSRNEGTPLAIIQAQLEGIPVISTAVGSISEIVVNGKTGDLVNDDVMSFRNSIVGYLNNERLRIQVGERARTRAVENFSAAKLIARHEDVYRSLTI